MDALLTCYFCPLPVNPEQAGTFKLITGWVETRRGGGAHAIRMGSPPQAFAHKHCINSAMRRGHVQDPLPGLLT